MSASESLAVIEAVRCNCPSCLKARVDESDRPEYFVPPQSGVSAEGKPIFSIEQAAQQLTREGLSWSGRDVLGVAVTLTYGFRLTAPTTLPEDVATFSTFSPIQIAAAELALKSWSDVANINFVRTNAAGHTDQATILFSNFTSPEDEDIAAFAFFPGSRNFDAPAGDIWIDSSLSYNQVPVVGNYGQQVLVHELGHALGLSHPSDYDAGETEEDITYAEHASYFQDGRQYTLMSYFGSRNTGAEPGERFGAAPQLHDIAAIQRLYGPNLGTRTGDTVYGFNSNADRPWFETSQVVRPVFSVWDAGGTDTFDFSGYAEAQELDLREGAFSNVGGLRGTVSIARGAVIEIGIGGSGADSLLGNPAANRLEGRAGDDQLYGDDGSDTLVGGAGDDRMEGQAGYDGLFGEDGNDVLIGGSEQDLLAGQNGQDRLEGGDADDQLYGDDGGDTLVGGAGADLMMGQAGDDGVFGEDGNDLLMGGPGRDLLAGQNGDDRLEGGDNDDQLYGDDGSDTLVGGPGADLIMGQAGFDGLYGDDGNDRLVGGPQQDLLAGQNGDDRLEGDEGDDQLYGDDGSDILVGGAGADRMFGQAGFDGLYGEDGNDLLIGGPGRDLLAGQNGDDRLEGGDDDDQLYGDDGADVLLGGAGSDLLAGQGGADRFVFTALSEGIDRVRDFSAASGDQIDLSAIDADIFTPGDQAFRFVSVLSGFAGEAVLAYNAVDDTTVILVDIGGGVTSAIAILAGEVGPDSGWVL